MTQNRNAKIITFFILVLIGNKVFNEFVSADTVTNKAISIDTSYIKPRNELIDYILDTGDEIEITFLNSPELTGKFTINEEGQIYLPRIRNAFVRGLTTRELTDLLQKRYKKYIISPDLLIKITRFKPMTILIRGEIRKPGIYTLDHLMNSSNNEKYQSLESNYKDIIPSTDQNNINNIDLNNLSSISINNNKSRRGKTLINQYSLKNSSKYLTTISDIILMAGGLTSYSDISKIEIIRDIPIGDGGGKKVGIINFTSYIKEREDNVNLRLYDGDSIFIPKLLNRNQDLIPSSILSGLSPKFINVTVAGEIENGGNTIIPLEGTLSDALDLSGPRAVLSGKIKLIRYNKDGSIIRKNINYSPEAKPGSNRNPYLESGDLITVKKSFIGRISKTVKDVTAPFIGIYQTKELIEGM